MTIPTTMPDNPQPSRKRINQTLPAAVHALLKYRAAREGVTLQDLIERILTDAAAEVARQVPPTS